MDKDSLIFLTGAVWNWAVAVSLFVLSVATPSAFLDLGMEIPNAMVWFHCTVGFVGVFGVAYFIAYKDLSARRGMALLGVVEKLFIFVVLFVYFLLEEVGVVGFGLIAVDLVYGMLFLWTLLHERHP
ncbi:MAG: hypothetical protein JW839_11720 [Candidatus Lokiarchaeota archaeon]|nr:hypothetical protein [Candidatus Lokiarchaeota archaeon]